MCGNIIIHYAQLAKLFLSIMEASVPHDSLLYYRNDCNKQQSKAWCKFSGLKYFSKESTVHEKCRRKEPRCNTSVKGGFIKTLVKQEPDDGELYYPWGWGRFLGHILTYSYLHFIDAFYFILNRSQTAWSVCTFLNSTHLCFLWKWNVLCI